MANVSEKLSVARERLVNSMLGGVPHPHGVVEAIEALIDAKLTERDPAPLTLATGLQLDQHGEGMQPPVFRQAAETDASYRGRLEACSMVAAEKHALGRSMDQLRVEAPIPYSDEPVRADGPEGCCAGGAVSRWAGSPCENCPRRPGEAE